MSKLRHSVYLYIALALALAGGAIVAITMVAASRQDQNSRATQLAVVKFETSHIFEAMSNKLSPMIFWQEAFDKVATRWDQKWVAYQFGPYLDSVDLNVVAIFDGSDHLKFLYTHNLKQPPVQADIANDAALRALVQGVRRAPQKLPPRIMSAFVKIRGQAYFAAAGQILPEDAKLLPVAADKTRIVVFLNTATASDYSALEGSFGVSNLRVEDSGAARGNDISYPLTDVNGRAVTRLWWNPERPGAKFLTLVLPLAILVFLFLAGTLGLVVRRWQQLQKAVFAAEQGAKIAHEESRAKSAFIGTISHELRTPLNAILGFSEILAHKLFGPLGAQQYDDYVDHIYSSGRSLLGTVNDVIEISRIEGGDTVLKLESADVISLLRDAVRTVTPAANAKSVKLAVPRAEGSLFVTTAPSRLTEIFVRLLDNAIKFSPDGQTVEIELGLGKMISVSIRDHGAGMDAATLARIGKPFSQAEGHLARSHGGLGLGLAISYGLARLMDCQIRVTSESGAGTLVTVELPQGVAAIPGRQAA
jgi:signal transduction histidine kinase